MNPTTTTSTTNLPSVQHTSSGNSSNSTTSTTATNASVATPVNSDTTNHPLYRNYPTVGNSFKICTIILTWTPEAQKRWNLSSRIEYIDMIQNDYPALEAFTLIRQLFLHDPDFIDELIGNYRSKANWAARLHQLDRIEFEKFPQNIVDYGPSNRKPIDSADATYTQTSGTGIRNPLTNYRSSDPQQVTWAADYFEHRRRIVNAFNTDMDLFKFAVETHPMAKAACEEYMQKNGYTAPGQYVGGIPSSSSSSSMSTRPKPKIISMLESRKLFKELITSLTPVLLWESKTARQARADANNTGGF